ncbi:MAG: hypothetical protein V4717_06545 [Bacteroidota bacterium]
MSIVICTLFEGHYHYGVAALTNSLYKVGYKGTIYVGYRGAMPSWASQAQSLTIKGWDECKQLQLDHGINLCFIRLNTDYHLTNYKPDFMLRIIESIGTEIEGIFYFDPDIVITAPWSFYKDWLECGIALCEDVNSPLMEFHPKRVAWRKYYKPFGLDLAYKNSIYVNGGFIGVNLKNVGFLNAWKRVQELMGEAIGGLNRSSLSGEQLPTHLSGDFAPFGKTDQDALNAAVEFYASEYSYLGKDAMSLARGISIMSHALGQPKAWHWSPFGQMFKGRPPRTADKDYWKVVDYPIAIYNKYQIRRMRVLISIAAFVGRFYKRN